MLNKKYLKRVISRNDRIICNKLLIHNIYHLFFIMYLPNINYLTEEQYKEEILENTENAYELIRLYKDYKIESDSFYNKNTIISNNIKSIKKDDFIRYSDKNLISKNVTKWFNKKSERLDVKVEEINQDNNSNITIQDIIDFILGYTPGGYKNEYEIKANQVNDKFKFLFGFNIKNYYVEHIINVIENTNYNNQEKLPF